MIKINSKSILIRKFKKKDIDDKYYGWFKNKKNFIFSRHKNKNYSKKNLLDYFNTHNQKPNSLFLVCIDKKKIKKIATLTIYIDKKYKVANLGILIGENEYKRKGLSSIILKKVFRYLFKKFDLNRIIMGTDSRNKPMVNSCLRIGMKKINEYSKDKKKIINFQKSRKNNLFIGVICKDLGAANQIFHYILRDRRNYYFLFLERPARDLFLEKKLSNQFICNNIKEIKTYCDFVLSGTGSSNFEKKNMLIIQRMNLKLEAVVDHLTDFDKRFKYRKQKIIPDKTLVFDEIIYNCLNKNKTVIKKPNYYLLNLKKNFLKLNIIKKNLLFIGEPFKKFNNRLSIDQIGLKLLAKHMKKLKLLNNSDLIIRLHPKQFKKDFFEYKKIVKKYCPSLNIILDKNKDLYKSIKSSKYVFGLTSYALLLSANLKVKTFHCLQPKQRIKPLPYKDILSFYELTLNLKQ